MTSSPGLWTERERSAWSPPEKLKPSEWSERYRFLPPSVSAEPGRYSNDRTPYVVGIVDACTETGVEEACLVKGVQIGGSELTRNAMGFWVDNDPGPCLVVMPDELSAREVVAERIKPLLNESPRLKEHVSGRPWDNKATTISLDTMPIFVGWAGSPQRLASRPIRYLVLDEVDKYPAFSGKESGPIELATERTTTYGHRRFVFKISTPTTRRGNIWRAWEASGDKRRFHVPCPHCGEFQSLDWQQVKWPDREDATDRLVHADRIEQGDLAWYECRSCSHRITDGHKPKMLKRGVWASEGQTVTKSGELVGHRERSKRVGFHLSSLYSPWVRFSALAAEFLRAKGSPAAMMSFRNNKLAEPFEEQSATSRPEVFEKKIALAGPKQVVPDWATAILMTADVQKDHLYYVIRAWGQNDRSQLVDYGLVTDFDALGVVMFERHVDGPVGSKLLPIVMAIDSKYRTPEVNKFCERDPSRLWPCQGSHIITSAPISESAVKGYEGVIRRTVNPNYWKTELAASINRDDAEHWLPHKEIGDDYVRQMTSEHQILDTRSNRYVWEPVSQGAANHLWDCEYHQFWLAQRLNVKAMPLIVQSIREHEQQRIERVRHEQEQERSPSSSGGSWATSYKRS